MRDIIIRTSPTTGSPFGIVLDRRLDGTSPEDIHAAVFASLQESREVGGAYTAPVDATPRAKPILSNDGQLDLGAVEDALRADEEKEFAWFGERSKDYGSVPMEEDVEGQVVKVSISHDGDYCVGMCIAPVMDVPGDVGGEAAARMVEL